MFVYVGERYLPGARSDQVTTASGRLQRAVATLAREGLPVRLLSSTFVPEQEWVLDLFEADAAAQVEQIYARAAVGAARISRGLDIASDQETRR